MKRPNRPAYWQLDLFVLLMIALLLLAMQAHLSSQLETAVEITWCVLIIVGMGSWVRANWAALLHEEREQLARAKRRVPAQPNTPARTLPLTPVQQQFLAVMAAAERQKDSR